LFTLINPPPKTKMSVLRTPIRQQATPTIEATPPRSTVESSGTIIPETLERNEQPSRQESNRALPNNATQLLILLGDAINELNAVKTSGNNKEYTENAKKLLEEAKHITRNILKENEEEKNQKMEQMSKDLNDIKRLLAQPKTFAQAAATELPRNPPETPTNQRKPDTAKEKIKKQQREKLMIIITAATAPDTTKNQLKAMHAKDMIQKCQSAITEYFTEGRVPKIHGINKLTNDEYRLHCESKEDPQLLSKMNWSLIFSGVKIKKRKYGLVIHGIPKKDLDPTTEDEIILRDEIEEENTSRNLQVAQVTPLRRTQKHLNKIAAHHSVVIFTHSIEEADECLKRGILIKGSFYYPEKYAPELNITQCYKCYKFGTILVRLHRISANTWIMDSHRIRILPQPQPTKRNLHQQSHP
jgi:hypothetical protein